MEYTARPVVALCESRSVRGQSRTFKFMGTMEVHPLAALTCLTTFCSPRALEPIEYAAKPVVAL